jgi:hypothetical protein
MTPSHPSFRTHKVSAWCIYPRSVDPPRRTLYQLTCKDYIKRTLVLEINAAKFELAKQFCTSIGALGIAYAIHTKLIHRIYARELVLLTVEDHHNELLRHSGLTLDDFWTKLKTSTLDPQDIHEVGSIEATTRTTIAPTIPPFSSIIKGS